MQCTNKPGLIYRHCLPWMFRFAVRLDTFEPDNVFVFRPKMASEDGTYIALLYHWGHEGATTVPSFCHRWVFECTYLVIYMIYILKSFMVYTNPIYFIYIYILLVLAIS